MTGNGVRGVRAGKLQCLVAHHSQQLRVAEVVEFTPALDGDKPVPVWISMPITFQTR